MHGFSAVISRWSGREGGGVPWIRGFWQLDVRRVIRILRFVCPPNMAFCFICNSFCFHSIAVYPDLCIMQQHDEQHELASSVVCGNRRKRHPWIDSGEWVAGRNTWADVPATVSVLHSPTAWRVHEQGLEWECDRKRALREERWESILVTRWKFVYSFLVGSSDSVAEISLSRMDIYVLSAISFVPGLLDRFICHALLQLRHQLRIPIITNTRIAYSLFGWNHSHFHYPNFEVPGSSCEWREPCEWCSHIEWSAFSPFVYDPCRSLSPCLVIAHSFLKSMSFVFPLDEYVGWLYFDFYDIVMVICVMDVSSLFHDTVCINHNFKSSYDHSLHDCATAANTCRINHNWR